MSFWSETRLVARLLAALPRFLRTPVTLSQARAAVEHGLRTREAAFLGIVELAVYGNPASPYLRLLRAADVELQDVRRLVTREGLEGALSALLAAGVYVTFEEFKGRAPARRGSQTFTFAAADFDNPLIRPHFITQSGGTSGRPTRINIHLDHIAQTTPQWVVWFATLGLLDSPLVFWIPSYFSINNQQLRCAKFGKKYVKWFLPVERTGSAVLTDALVRWVGGFRAPEYAPLSAGGRVADYLSSLVREGPPPCVVASPSAAVRVSISAQDRGLPLTGVTFLLGYEPLTEARRQTIEASGARAAPLYGTSESPTIGSQCLYPTAVDDVHVCLDTYAITQRPRPLGHGESVDALLLTALQEASPKIILNMEIGDSGVLVTRRCQCLLDELGYTQHLHTIRSFEKLTGEGVSILGADLYPLMESLFPSRFGGGVLDYQLIERQDERGLPRYDLRINPEVGPVDERAAVRLLLSEVGRLTRGYGIMAQLWKTAGVVQVKREPPIPTPRGKVLPFRTLRAP